ncbi:diguanylate cyclase [Bacillus sp. MUM 116]|uniref:HD-GYP domain-containing protein n=1 Tax=Bacillus sp. MUM 116 TaxID=1678002 RepID=UPI0008F5F135|nr:HD-GYP domain-containing protein [Bacillus sp. MUM 116]OIK15702.1 diguanylate cyclase [Bacillus sp. MUM 116]
MERKIQAWLNKPIYFRYGFLVILIASTYLNLTYLKDERIYIFYVLATVFLGIGFFNQSPLFLVICTSLIVTCRYSFAPNFPGVGTFFVQLGTYLLIMAISVGLMKHNQRIKKDHIEMIITLSKALDSRDTYTSQHSENVANYSLKIAKKMKLSSTYCDLIYKAGLLHDIGKIGIPEHILTKPGKLTEEEYSIIKEHPMIGNEMIKHVYNFRETGILEGVLYHHERYDGKGYPQGLKGNEIPLIARILAVADTFDAMTSKRVYRMKLDLRSALTEIEKNKGTQFDPQIAEVFLSLFNKEQQIDYQMESPKMSFNSPIKNNLGL